MPIFLLQVHAELEGVAKFWAPANHCWKLDVKQGAGSEERNGVIVDPEEVSEVPDTKNATCNFMVKFPGDKSPSTLSVLSEVPTKKKGQPPIIRPQTADDSELVTIAAFECRGMEPVRWHPTTGYCVETEGGTVYDSVDLETEDWCEYDEKSEEAMSVGQKIRYEFNLHRG